MSGLWGCAPRGDQAAGSRLARLVSKSMKMSISSSTETRGAPGAKRKFQKLTM